jgi:hypothetical protein
MLILETWTLAMKEAQKATINNRRNEQPMHPMGGGYLGPLFS